MIKSLAYLGVNSPRQHDWRKLRHRSSSAPSSPRTAPTVRCGCASTTPPGGSRSTRPRPTPSPTSAGPSTTRRTSTWSSSGWPPPASPRSVGPASSPTPATSTSWSPSRTPGASRTRSPGASTPTPPPSGRAVPVSGFVTGTQGLGHVLLLIPDIEKGHAFFNGVLGFELSDKIIVPGQLNARFYHVNARHHTLALGECPPGVAGFNHLMLQTKSIDDVGSAYDMLEEHAGAADAVAWAATPTTGPSASTARLRRCSTSSSASTASRSPPTGCRRSTTRPRSGATSSTRRRRTARRGSCIPWPTDRLVRWPTDTVPGAMRPGQLPFRRRRSRSPGPSCPDRSAVHCVSPCWST